MNPCKMFPISKAIASWYKKHADGDDDGDDDGYDDAPAACIEGDGDDDDDGDYDYAPAASMEGDDEDGHDYAPAA
ncbi:hypothetical protein L1049_001253 [Liquidambar formosana]|uniref:Uncharacterized protein n=1 Tax=Liquidambar formosana TaxID=63359 RepID=A0AAP0NA96_LIQFO